ncbi:undecaprenyl-phosphate glucose phosphotransferase [Acinetobacter qingfengensis]|uniref:Undecaprenyl-phosphate glucose phosphotransferase n=1 Tax=Acinetobacter qingfengensis TaxID=1262585 RepID=A0A1E7RCW2_9GAMM|nr:undecaprenyl-phosphate glucose phosphotransferase [Acinetobacter qingfengensis]KAA8732052.1 undecaprenyl-phosphate glucose phosphotransferase [Acinetobacter qingfengensis]OEY97133.1 undecaprenyl-phosphate glucose phosphotransferase [Acinetobacter qingfengensis]
MSTKLNATNISIFYRIFDFLSLFIGLYLSCYFLDIHVSSKDITFICLIQFLFFLFICEITDFYRSSKGMRLRNQIEILFTNIFFSSLITFFVFIVNDLKDFDYRLAILTFIVTCLSAFSFRILLRISYRKLIIVGTNLQNTLVIGDTKRAAKVLKEIEYSKWRGYNSLGLYSFQNEVSSESVFSGTFDDVKTMLQDNKIDKIYVIIDKHNLSQAEELLTLLTDSTCTTIIVPDLFQLEYLYTKVEDLNRIPTIPLIDTDIQGINAVLKRIEDIVFSLMIITLISPILIVISIAIKLTSEGPVLFKQTRYGLNGKPITVFKFRSMRVMENGHEVKQATKNDPRVTKVGAFIRRTSLDELPQFFNVLLGTMSIVGPRPHAVSHNEQYRKLIPGYMLRHKVKPGITGLAQINGWRGETDTLDKMEKRIECDLMYIKNWSIWLDVKIIFLTVFKGFINKSAY